eukprot:12938696-Prorocentrum_lima.AAC.1
MGGGFLVELDENAGLKKVGRGVDPKKPKLGPPCRYSVGLQPHHEVRFPRHQVRLRRVWGNRSVCFRTIRLACGAPGLDVSAFRTVRFACEE